MLEAEKEGSVEKANRILGKFEAKHPGLLAARMYCEVGFLKKKGGLWLGARFQTVQFRFGRFIPADGSRDRRAFHRLPRSVLSSSRFSFLSIA